MKGAQYKGGVIAIHVTPEVDLITVCDALRTAEETEQEREWSRGAKSPWREEPS